MADPLWWAATVQLAEGQRVCGAAVADKLEPYGEAAAILEFARAEAGKRARHLQHPQLCLDAIQAGVQHGGAVGLKKVGHHAAVSPVAAATASQLGPHKGCKGGLQGHISRFIGGVFACGAAF
jgi:hypothetical protein